MKDKIGIAIAAAISLARAGRAVEVHEAKPDVGTRFIGDLQIIEAASEAEAVPDFLDRIGIEPNFYFRPVTSATFYDARGNARIIRSSTVLRSSSSARRGPASSSR